MEGLFAKRDGHWEPPFEAGPGRPLPHPARPLHDRVEVARGGWQERVREPLVELPLELHLEAFVASHAVLPSRCSRLVRASASRVARSAWMARCSRDFAVP